MPKVLVLFDNADQNADGLAELVSAGAKTVRFTEVDVRVLGEPSVSSRRRRLESADEIEQYDGVIVVGSDPGISPAFDSLLGALGRRGTAEFDDRVFAAVPASSATRQRLSDVGGIIVGVRAGAADAESEARKTGERVARVTEWVRHALSHEDGHGQPHHAHSHHHSH